MYSLGKPSTKRGRLPFYKTEEMASLNGKPSLIFLERTHSGIFDVSKNILKFTIMPT